MEDLLKLLKQRKILNNERGKLLKNRYIIKPGLEKRGINIDPEIEKKLDIVKNKISKLSKKLKKLREKYNCYFVYTASNHISSVREKYTSELLIQTNLKDPDLPWPNTVIGNKGIHKNYKPINIKAPRNSIWIVNE